MPFDLQVANESTCCWGKISTLQQSLMCLFFHLEIKAETEKCKQPDWVHEGHAIKANTTSLSQTQTPIWFFKDGNFQEKQVIFKIKPLHDQNCLHLIKDHLVQEIHNLRQLQSPHRSGISFLLGLGKEPVQRHLITAFQRLGNFLKLAKERNTYWQMHTDTADDRQSLGRSNSILVHGDEPKSSGTMDLLLSLFKGKTHLNTTIVN